MSKLYRIGDAARILGVSVQTLRRWDKDRPNAVAIYARVSSHDQKKELESQLEFLRKAVSGNFSCAWQRPEVKGHTLGHEPSSLLQFLATLKSNGCVSFRLKVARFPYRALWKARLSNSFETHPNHTIYSQATASTPVPHPARHPSPVPGSVPLPPRAHLSL